MCVEVAATLLAVAAEDVLRPCRGATLLGSNNTCMDPSFLDITQTTRANVN